MKKISGIRLFALLAAVLCLAAALWLSGSRPALLDSTGGLPEEDGGGLADIADEEVPLAGAPEEDAPASVFTEEQTAAIREVLTLVNAARSEAGVSPLELDWTLCEAAQVRAQECVGTFSHTRPDGSSYKTAISQAGLSSGYTGENVATGHTSPQQVVDSWLKSEGHRANLLNASFTKLGVGLAPNSGTRYKGYAWAQLFIA